MTPYELSFLMHIHTTPTPFPYDGTEIYDRMVNDFLCDKIIDNHVVDGCRYKLTLLGRAWLTSILQTPKPTQAFIDYKGDVIDVL